MLSLSPINPITILSGLMSLMSDTHYTLYIPVRGQIYSPLPNCNKGSSNNLISMLRGIIKF